MSATMPDARTMDPMELVEVYTVNDPTMAEVIKATLQRDGITCWIEGENQAGLACVLTISLLVRARDADRAMRIIRTFDGVKA